MLDSEDLFFDLKTKAKSKAVTHKSTATQFKSWMSQKKHKLSKPGNMAKTIASGAGAAIPIPGLSIASDWVIQKAADRQRSKSHAKKKLKYDDSGRDDYHSVKWDIKELDVKHLDQSRLKLHMAADAYNKLAGKFWPDKTCERAYDLLFSEAIFNDRLDKLKMEAECLKAVADGILEWCDTLDSNLDRDKMHDDVIKALEHENCGKDCFHSPDGESKLVSYASRVRHFPGTL